MVKNCLLALLAFIGLAGSSLNGQELLGKQLFISPGINLGYTFNAKLTIGFVLDIGLCDEDACNTRYGLSFGYDLIRVEEKFHRKRVGSIMFQNDFFDLKFGFGRIRNGWGFENRNSCIVRGLSTDLSLSYPSLYSPCIGLKAFIFNKGSWAWFEHNYYTIYLGYENNLLKRTH